MEEIKASSRDRHPGVGKGQEYIEGVKEINHRYSLKKMRDGTWQVVYSKRTDMVYDTQESAKDAFMRIDDAKEVVEDTEDEQQTEEQDRERKNYLERERRRRTKEDDVIEQPTQPQVQTSLKENMKKTASFGIDAEATADGYEVVKVTAYDEATDTYTVTSTLFGDTLKLKSNRLSATAPTLPAPIAKCACGTRMWMPKGHTGTQNEQAEGFTGSGPYLNFSCPGCGAGVPNGINMGDPNAFMFARKPSEPSANLDNLMSSLKSWGTMDVTAQELEDK